MAGTLPHAVFVETGTPPDGGVLAFAAELPGCAAGGATPEAAVATLPAQVATFTAWLRAHGQEVEEPVGNWYEVERAAAGSSRAVFSLDDLEPNAAERATWLEWLELAREELAARLDGNPAAPEALAGWRPRTDGSPRHWIGSRPGARNQTRWTRSTPPGTASPRPWLRAPRRASDRSCESPSPTICALRAEPCSVKVHWGTMSATPGSPSGSNLVEEFGWI